jgi:hypothetical protein
MSYLGITSSAKIRATGTLRFTWKQWECSHFIACLFRNAAPSDVLGTRGQSWRYWAEPEFLLHSDPSWIGLKQKYKYIPSKSNGTVICFMLLSLQVYFPRVSREAKYTPTFQGQGAGLMCGRSWIRNRSNLNGIFCMSFVSNSVNIF